MSAKSKQAAAEVRRCWSPPGARPWSISDVAIMRLLKAVEEEPDGIAARRGLVAEVVQVLEAFRHTVPAEGGDDLDRIGRYSNGTIDRAVAAVRALAEKKT